MGRKPSAETSPVYGSFLVSLLFRSVSILTAPDQEPSPNDAKTLDNALQSYFEIPEVKEWAAIALALVKSKSQVQWNQITLEFVAFCFNSLSRALTEEGRPDPFRRLSLDDKIGWLLAQIGWEGSFEEIASEWQETIISSFERISAGDSAELAAWSKGIASGLFGDDPKRAVALIRFSLMAGGGKDLLNEVDTAVKIVRDKLNASIEFEAAVELVEKRQHWGGHSADQKFRRVWENLHAKVMGRLRGKLLAIPGPQELNEFEQKTWNEEEELAMVTIYEELCKRASEQPFKLIADAWSGKLASSLVVAAENDLRDKITYERAQKRDATKRVSLEDVEDADHKKVPAQFASYTEEPLDILVKEDNWRELMRPLTEEEKGIVTKKQEGFKQHEIGQGSGKSQAWVSSKLKGIREKLKNLR